MSKEVLNMEMSKDIFQTLDGVSISWPWKKGGGGLSTSGDGEFTFEFGSIQQVTWKQTRMIDMSM